MKAKLTIDGKEFEVEISEEQIQDLTKKKTGYERVKRYNRYYIETADGTSGFLMECFDRFDCERYEGADYYSDKTVAENNARADKLYRQLRRFAVEHRINEIDWDNGDMEKCNISYSHYRKELYINSTMKYQHLNLIYFDSYETAQLAIDTFKDELLWYFTEYKDSL